MTTPESKVRFFEACAGGDVAALDSLLAADPSLARTTDENRPHGGWTGLHAAAERGRLAAVRLLLQHGADPNAREAGDETYPLHWAAAKGHLEIVRTLLDAGGDVHGIGDLHELDAIGWVAYFGGAADACAEVVALLLERGARHHVHSAIAIGDLAAIRELAADNPGSLDRRMSRFEEGRTALQHAIRRKRFDIVDLLIELGADLEARNAGGHTAIEGAILRGDGEALRRLTAAGAKPARHVERPKAEMQELAGSVSKCVVMMGVPDIAAALDWYVSIGFTETGRYAEGGLVNFGIVSIGKAELMFRIGPTSGEEASFWFYTDRVDEIYQTLMARQFEAVETGREGVVFVEDLNDTFYGAREFGIRDLNGYVLYFIQTMEG